LRGAKFRKDIIDYATNTHTIEPAKEKDLELCSEALLEVAEHMDWHNTEAYLRNMHKVKEQILEERNKE
jgi:queuine/archaeosine tRNA-ribosyltransferase